MSDQIKFSRFATFKNSHNGAKLDVEVTRATGGRANFDAFLYRCHLVEDNDGAPNCYGLNNPVNIFAGADLGLGPLVAMMDWPHVQKKPESPGEIPHPGSRTGQRHERRPPVERQAFLLGCADGCDRERRQGATPLY